MPPRLSMLMASPGRLPSGPDPNKKAARIGAARVRSKPPRSDLIPPTGFPLTRTPAITSGRIRQAVSNRGYFTARDSSPALTVAGLWDEWRNPETGQPLKSCTMIITEPNDFVAEIHDRMPVLLTERQFEPWLCGEAGQEYLKPPPNDFLQKWPVAKRVNSSRADPDDSTLIEKVELAAA